MSAAAAVRALRPNQWMKNVLVLAAPAGAGILDDTSALGRVIVAFVAFCLASSATYLINDLVDIDADRAHPQKRHRPLASRQLAPSTATALTVALIALALAVAPIARVQLMIVVAIYLALTISYSRWLKHIVLVDVAAVSAGFLLRAAAGGVATDVPLSGWFYLVISTSALLLISGKRLGEKLSSHQGRETRRVLAVYTAPMLRGLVALAAAASVVGYALWANDQAPTLGRSDLVYLSAIPFAAAILRYVAVALTGRAENPEVVLLRDPWLLAAGGCWAILYGAALYG